MADEYFWNDYIFDMSVAASCGTFRHHDQIYFLSFDVSIVYYATYCGTFDNYDKISFIYFDVSIVYCDNYIK